MCSYALGMCIRGDSYNVSTLNLNGAKKPQYTNNQEEVIQINMEKGRIYSRMTVPLLLQKCCR